MKPRQSPSRSFKDLDGEGKMVVKPKHVDCDDFIDQFSDGGEVDLEFEVEKETSKMFLEGTGDFGKAKVFSMRGKDKNEIPYLCMEIGTPRINEDFYSNHVNPSVLFSFDPSLIKPAEAKKLIRQELDDAFCTTDMYSNVKIDNEDLCDLD